MSHNALILQHGDWGPPGVLGDWANERGIAFDIHYAHRGEPLPELNGQAFIASLGSPHNPADTHIESVARELDYLEQATERGIPVLGLCFGGQMLARVLGGTIERAREPELGWCAIESSAPDVVPEGPWLQWHYDAFTLPPGAEQLASSRAGVQAFAHGPHLGVQFHPESTIEIVKEWARVDADRVRDHGVDDGEALLESGRHHAEPAARAAFHLFDAFWERARS
jgi:GMP synthase-like glutamine amidotransferase